MKKEYHPGEEIKESLPRREVAFAFIKPDFIKDLPEIYKILKKHGLEIVYQDQVRLSPEAVDLMYADSQQEHFYETMKKYLTEHDVIVLMVSGEGLEAQKVLLSLKKDGGKDGEIRQKLQKDPRVPAEEWQLWNAGQHPRQEEVSIVLTQRNVLHTADTTEEALESLKAILGDKFEVLKKRGNLPAELWDLFN